MIFLSKIVYALKDLSEFAVKNRIEYRVVEGSEFRSSLDSNLRYLLDNEKKYRELLEDDLVSLLTLYFGSEMLVIDLVYFDSEHLEIKIGSGDIEEGFRDVDYFTICSEEDFKEFEGVFVSYIEHVKKLILHWNG